MPAPTTHSVHGTPQNIVFGASAVASWGAVTDARVVSANVKLVTEKVPLPNQTGTNTGFILIPLHYEGQITVEVESDKALPVEGDDDVTIGDITDLIVEAVEPRWERKGLKQATITVFKPITVAEPQS